MPPGTFARSDDVPHATLALARRLLIAPMTSIPATAHHAMPSPRRTTAEGGEFVCSIVVHPSARATCFPHFLDQPRQVSLGPLLQFIYRVVAVVDADLF